MGENIELVIHRVVVGLAHDNRMYCIVLSLCSLSLQNSEFEARLQELVKSESSLKIRVIELEKREMHMK